MGFEGFSTSQEDIKQISEEAEGLETSALLGDLKDDVKSQITDSLLQKEAFKEIAEFKQKIKENKESVIGESKIILNDLKEELIEDLNALNNLEDNFGDKNGYNEFKKLFLSGSITDNQRELVYDLIESGEFKNYIDDEFDGDQIFPDKESIDDFISYMKENGFIENGDNKDSEILEIKKLKIEDLSLSELEYYSKKIEKLNDIASNSDLKDLNKMNDKIIKNILINKEDKAKNQKGEREEERKREREEERKREREEERKREREEEEERKREREEEEERKREREEEERKREREEERKEKNVYLNKQEKVLEELKKEQEKKEKSESIIKSMKKFVEGVKLNHDSPVINELLGSIDKGLKNISDKKGNIIIEKVNDIDKIADSIIEKMLEGNNLKKILIEAKKGGKYKETYQFLETLASVSGNSGSVLLLQKLENIGSDIESIYKSNEIATGSLIRNKEIENFFGGTDGIDKNGDKFIFGDKMVDFSEIPPKAFFVNSNGYKLETEMQGMDNTKEIIENRRKLQTIKLDIKDTGDKLNKLGVDLDRLNKIPERDRTENEKNEIIRVDKEIKVLIEKIKELVIAANKIKEFFDNPESKIFNEKNNELKEKQEIQKKNLEFLGKIGFDLIPQTYTDFFIKEMMLGKIQIEGFSAGNIDISNGKFGESPSDSSSSKGKCGLFSSQAKKLLVEFMNKMITGNVDKPLNYVMFQGDRGADLRDSTLQNMFIESGIKDTFTWNKSKILGNLSSNKQINNKQINK